MITLTMKILQSNENKGIKVLCKQLLYSADFVFMAVCVLVCVFAETPAASRAQ